MHPRIFTLFLSMFVFICCFIIFSIVLQHCWHIPHIKPLLLQASSSILELVHHTDEFFSHVMQVFVQML